MKLGKDQEAFLDLVRAGLWEQEVQLSQFGEIDFKRVYRLAQEQSVVGLVAAGIEHLTDRKIPQPFALQFAGDALQLELRNQSMNQFLCQLQGKLNDLNIKAVLVKGQGVAQCYEKPLWRAAGDVDLILSHENYEAAKTSLKPLAEEIATENTLNQHQALTIQGFDVELHGRMPFLLSTRADALIDDVIKGTTEEGMVRIWKLDASTISLPAPGNDIFLVFTHFLHHFFIEGVGLRQICDWCRLLWTFRSSINLELLEARLRKAGLMSEWKVFASLAVNFLGIQEEVMPFYENRKYDKKALCALKRVLKCGNMGHNNDVSYRWTQSGFIANIITFYRRFIDFSGLSWVFPIDAPKFFIAYVFKRINQ